MRVLIAFILGILPAAAETAITRPFVCTVQDEPAPNGLMLICDSGLYAGFVTYARGTLGGRLICRRIDTAKCFPDLLFMIADPKQFELRKGSSIRCEQSFDLVRCELQSLRR